NASQGDLAAGEHPPAKSPNPSPVPDPDFIEGLIGGAAEEILPGDLAGVAAHRRPPEPRGAASVPAQVDLEDLADPTRLDQLAGLLDVRHAPLLHADLDDSAVTILSIGDRRAPRGGVGQWLLGLDLLARVAS